MELVRVWGQGTVRVGAMTPRGLMVGLIACRFLVQPQNMRRF